MMSQTSLRLHITAVPPGEAPEWVRQKWVGLSLPLAQEGPAPRWYFTHGVVSGPRSRLSRFVALVTGRMSRNAGYKIEVLEAIRILEAAHPEAAEWWRENAPHLLRARRYFLFPRESGHVVEEGEFGRLSVGDGGNLSVQQRAIARTVGRVNARLAVGYVIYFVATPILLALSFLVYLILWPVISLYKLGLLLGVWFHWKARGKDTVVITMEDAGAKERLARILPLLSERAVCLDESASSTRRRWDLASRLYRCFGSVNAPKSGNRKSAFPIVIVCRRFRRPRVFRFDHHLRGPESVAKALEEFLAELETGESRNAG